MQVLNDFVARVVVQIINPIMLLLAAGAFVLFLWGVVKFIAHAGDGEGRAEGRSAIVWGLVGLVIIFGAYGLINLAAGAFNLGPVHKITLI
jgi:type VI protein secretion system component VasK